MKLTKLIPIAAMLLIVFMGGCKKDDDPGVRPRVLATSPVNEANSISTNAVVTASFSEEMDPFSITTAQFTIQKDGVNVAQKFGPYYTEFGEDENLAPFENRLPEERFYNRTVIIDIIPTK